MNEAMRRMAGPSSFVYFILYCRLIFFPEGEGSFFDCPVSIASLKMSHSVPFK